MKILDIFVGSVVMGISSLPLILLLLAFQVEPAVPANPPLDQAQLGEIQQLLIDHDPRQLLASDYQEVRLTGSELNALITYIKGSNPVLEDVNIRAGLAQAAASVDFSVPVSALGLQRYVNVSLQFSHVDDTLVLDRVDAGALSVPRVLLEPVRELLAGQLRDDPNFQLVSAFTGSLHFQDISPERAVILLDWQEDNLETLEDQAREVFVSAREAERLQYYHERLAATIADLPAAVGTVTLNDLMRPLFLFASLNSASGASAAAENRAVFIVLTAYQTDLELEQLIGGDTALATPRQLKVVIGPREDLARHVVSAAAIAASAGATMAEVLSVYKEVHDSRYRTGFSFTDIAANQVGTLLGDLATRSEADALRFQELMQASVDEADYMPALGTYDGMTEEEFTATYGNRDSEAYRQRLQEITDSIVTLPFYRTFGE